MKLSRGPSRASRWCPNALCKGLFLAPVLLRASARRRSGVESWSVSNAHRLTLPASVAGLSSYSRWPCNAASDEPNDSINQSLVPSLISPSSPQALTLASIAGPRSRLISQDFRHSSNVWPSHFRFHPDHTRYSPLLLLPAALACTALRRGSTYEMGLFHVSPDCHPWLA